MAESNVNIQVMDNETPLNLEVKEVSVEMSVEVGAIPPELAAYSEDAAASREAAEASEINASASEQQAAGSQSAASTSEANAADSAAAALASENNAASSAIAAEASETASLASENKAEQWAQEAIDTEVEPGRYSANHYSAKAEGSANAAATSEANAASSESAASVSESNAAASAIDASNSASAALDSENVASASAVAASDSAGAAAVSEANAYQYSQDALAISTQALILKGEFDASTGVFPSDPDLNNGWTYVVNTAGTAAGLELAVGDSITYKGGDSSLKTSWIKTDNTDSVKSVNGYQGVVNLGKADVGLGNVRNVSSYSQTEADALLAGKTDNTDPRLSDSREWSAATVDQAEAEGGTSTVRRAWSSLRVRQAINSVVGAIGNATQTVAGWMSADDKTKLDTLDIQSTVSQAEAEAGISTTRRAWTAQRVRQAISKVIESIGNATQTVAGWMSPDDKTKLDGIEAGATGDQTGPEIKASYEAEANTNAFTDAEQSKLSSLNKTTSQTDTTAGRLLKVGDFGLGVNSSPAVSDCNAQTTTGMFRATGSSNGRPSAIGSAGGTLVVHAYSSSYIFQEFSVPRPSPRHVRTFQRWFSANAWTEWVELCHSHNPIIMSGRIGTAITHPIGPQKIPFNEFWVNKGGITYNTGSRRFYVPETGVYRVTLNPFKINSQSTYRVFIGHNTDTPSASSNKGHSYGNGTDYQTGCLDSLIQLHANDFIVFYLQSGGLYNQSSDRFNNFTIERVSA